jgi:hypothetical protein
VLLLHEVVAITITNTENHRAMSSLLLRPGSHPVAQAVTQSAAGTQWLLTLALVGAKWSL